MKKETSRWSRNSHAYLKQRQQCLDIKVLNLICCFTRPNTLVSNNYCPVPYKLPDFLNVFRRYYFDFSFKFQEFSNNFEMLLEVTFLKMHFIARTSPRFSAPIPTFYICGLWVRVRAKRFMKKPKIHDTTRYLASEGLRDN